MEYASQTGFGRPESCALAPAPSETTQSDYDKWDLLAALTKGAADFDLSHRTLTVLKALMTFLPGRAIGAEPGSAIVFPSNRTLSDRLSGMPESTLRRHLSRLADLGIVSRHSSPNGKRFARRVGQGILLAFGFDLSPLARHAPQIFSAAQQAQLQHQRIQVLRDQIAAQRAGLMAAGQGVETALLDLARLTLRRKADEQTLTDLLHHLQAQTALLLPVDNSPTETTPLAKMSTNSSQNERHIQNSIEYVYDSEESQPQTAVDDMKPAPKQAQKTHADANLAQVLKACPEFQTFYPGRIRQWQDLDQIAEKVSPMIGIDAPVLHEARAAMGRQQAATAVMCILERLKDIRSPGAYLRRLSQKARLGHFSIVPMLNALIQMRDTAELSADKPIMC